jgi:hypothetical protein
MPLQQILNKDHLNAFVNVNPKAIVLVDDDYQLFSRPLSNEVSELAATIPSITFATAALNHLEGAGQELEITQVPTFVYFENGTKVRSATGEDISTVLSLLPEQ